MRHILKCSKCSKYTMEQKCACGGGAVTPKPAKYSPDDKYASYRRKTKQAIYEKEGLL